MPVLQRISDTVQKRDAERYAPDRGSEYHNSEYGCTRTAKLLTGSLNVIVEVRFEA